MTERTTKMLRPEEKPYPSALLLIGGMMALILFSLVVMMTLLIVSSRYINVEVPSLILVASLVFIFCNREQFTLPDWIRCLDEITTTAHKDHDTMARIDGILETAFDYLEETEDYYNNDLMPQAFYAAYGAAMCACCAILENSGINILGYKNSSEKALPFLRTRLSKHYSEELAFLQFASNIHAGNKLYKKATNAQCKRMIQVALNLIGSKMLRRSVIQYIENKEKNAKRKDKELLLQEPSKHIEQARQYLAYANNNSHEPDGGVGYAFLSCLSSCRAILSRRRNIFRKGILFKSHKNPNMDTPFTTIQELSLIPPIFDKDLDFLNWATEQKLELKRTREHAPKMIDLSSALLAVAEDESTEQTVSS